MKVEEFLQCLVSTSAKAANIARACRREPALFELLVEEKKGEDKNAKFDQDFKTLADVLIQETVRHDVSRKYHVLANNIFGEESNKFTNKIGESVELTIQENENETKWLLKTVLNDNEEAAELLAKEVHCDIPTNKHVKLDIDLELDAADIGIWIDPIDATSQYIKGGDEGVIADGYLPTKGLQVH